MSSWAILATGPSLTQQQADAVRGMNVIAVSDAYRLAPWASALYSCDRRWWDMNPQALQFTGRKLSWESVPGVERVIHTDDFIGPRPSNSGYQAINLALRFGARLILLLGFDMKCANDRKSHFFGQHKRYERAHPYGAWRCNFKGLALRMAEAGVVVFNCTPGSALTCFPRMELADALQIV